MRDLLTCYALIAAAVVCVGGVAYVYRQVHANEHDVTCTVTGKSLGTGKHRHRELRGHNSQCGTLANETSLWFAKSSRDVRGIGEELRDGGTYVVRVAGARADFLGRYPNIIRIVCPAT